MDPAKIRKVEEYVVQLKGHAESREANGDPSGATKDYLKLVDALLFLAGNSDDHPTWVNYTKQAEYYQQKAKKIIASSGFKRQQSEEQDARAPQDPAKNVQESQSGGEKPGQLKRIIGVFHKGEDKNELQSKNDTTAPLEESHSTAPYSVQTNSVPFTLYAQALAKNKELQERISNMVDKSEYLSLVARNKELLDKMESMVLREDYERLQIQLSNTVPRSIYEELQRTCAAMVPKDLYLAAELKSSKIQMELDNSVPKSVLDELYAKIALLSTLAQIPVTDEIEKVQLLDKKPADSGAKSQV